MRCIIGYGELFRISYAFSLDSNNPRQLFMLGRFDQAMYYSKKLPVSITRIDQQVDIDYSKITSEILNIKESIIHEPQPQNAIVRSTTNALKDNILIKYYTMNRIHIPKIVELSKTPPNPNSKEHSKKIQDLWNAFFPEYSKDSSQYHDFTLLGFQQKEPWNDLRGVGMLGIELLVYYGQKFPNQARLQQKESYDESRSDMISYPMGLVGLHISRTMIQKISQHDPVFMDMFYQSGDDMEKYRPGLPFFEWFCYAMILFHKDWYNQEVISSIMDFEVKYYNPYWVSKKLAWMRMPTKEKQI